MPKKKRRKLKKKLVSALDTSFFFDSDAKRGIERNNLLVSLESKVVGREPDGI